MAACEDLGKRINELATLEATAIPAWAMDHLATCPSCTRMLLRNRVARGLLATASEEQEPPADFARRVLAALPASPPGRVADPELWRLSWRLVPAFAATAALALALFEFEARVGPTPSGPTAGLIPVEAFSASERLVLEGAQPELDLVLAAVMEGDGR
jgi:hypothetical protein